MTTTPALLTVAVGNAPKKINIAPPVDTGTLFTEADLRVIVTGLPADGTVYLADGVTPVLNGEYLSAVQLAGLTFVGSTVGSSSFTYTAIDPTAQIVTGSTTVSSGTSASGTVTFTVTANTTGPVTTSGTLSVNAGATATSIGIVAPTDPTDPPSSLTVTVLGLPEYGLPVSGTPTSVGTVTLSDGVTPVFVGETLTMSQLTGLMFTPTAGDTAFSTQFSYAVTDSSGNSSLGTATLNINPTSATIWTVGFVGPGGVTKQKSTIQAAITAAANGDTIEVLAGTYFVSSDIKIGSQATAKNITLEGFGGMVNLVATSHLSKGMLVTNGNDTINNFSFTGATAVPPFSANGAGIVYESGNLVLNNDYFFNNQDGLRGNPLVANTGSVTVNNSMFANNGVSFQGTSTTGTGFGFTHNIYIGDVATLTIDNSYFFNSNEGHEVKSRAFNTIIENSRIVDGPTGTASFSIDLPNGGNATIQNNIIEKGPRADGSVVIFFGEEGSVHPSSSLQVTGNTIINDLTAHSTVVVNNTTNSTTNTPNVIAQITNNAFYGLTAGQIDAKLTDIQLGNTFSPIGSAPALSSSQPWAEIGATPCFLRGTLIITEAGEVPVEELAIGDNVVTLSGETKPIRWIGRRAYDGRFVAGNRMVLPIRIAANALGDRLPARDLWVSPKHALYIDDVLVPAENLVNGATIVQADEIERIEYFHIELAAHEIIFAEGAPTESFVDCDNRGMFQNSDEFARLYPGDTRPAWQFCAPRRDERSAELLAIRAALLERAEALGHVLDRDPDLQLIVDGHAIRPSSVIGSRYRFDIPAGSTAVWLASRSTVPAETVAASCDIRRLGVAVERIVMRHADRVIEAWHSDATLCEGFHEDEASHRWTDGLARLPETWLQPFPGGATLDVQLSPTELGYRRSPPARIAAAA